MQRGGSFMLIWRLKFPVPGEEWRWGVCLLGVDVSCQTWKLDWARVFLQVNFCVEALLVSLSWTSTHRELSVTWVPRGWVYPISFALWDPGKCRTSSAKSSGVDKRHRSDQGALGHLHEHTSWIQNQNSPKHSFSPPEMLVGFPDAEECLAVSVARDLWPVIFTRDGESVVRIAHSVWGYQPSLWRGSFGGHISSGSKLILSVHELALFSFDLKMLS